jgi:hypothetical protein
MKKVLALVFTLLVTLVVFTIPVAAVQPVAGNEAAVAANMALAIKAPASAAIGEQVPIYVVERVGGAPVAQAGVWAVDVNNAGDIPVTSNVAADELGIFLGWTDSTGLLPYMFQETGRYLLVAVKDGYSPGFKWIKITPLKKMALKAPDLAQVGEEVVITAFEPDNGPVIAGAAIWALSLTNDNVPPGTENNIVDVVKSQGFLLGYTNNLGQVSYKFQLAGRYLLMGLKDGYTPAFAKITIKEGKELVVKAPETVQLLEKVPIRVLELSVLTVEIPVAYAAVWAVNIGNIPATAAKKDYEELVKKHGIFLGWTNTDGYVDPYPVFHKPGKYCLVALKDGYTPGFTKILVKPLTTATVTPFPLKSQAAFSKNK